jgi:hypothetical protein
MTPAETILYQKIKRKLRPLGQMLKASRGERQKTELGQFYVQSGSVPSVIVMHHVNL